MTTKNIFNEFQLMIAIQRQDYEDISRILQKTEPNFSFLGLTPLMLAAKKCNANILELILQNGGRANELNKRDRSAISYAVSSGNLSAFNILSLVAPESILVRDKNGLSPINIAYFSKKIEIFNSLENDGYVNSMPLHALEKLKEVETNGKGESIDSLNISLQNKTNSQQNGTILPGTIFHTKDDCQNMICTEETEFEIGPFGIYKMKVPVACIDAEKRIPTKNDNFNSTSYKNQKLINIINELEDKNFNTKQAAIWAYTNSLTENQIINRLREGRTHRTVITREEIHDAKEALNNLNIRNKL